jgi:hypothetical protein
MPFGRVGNMAKLPFSVFRRTGQRYYSVSFKNETTGEYMPAISTKQEKEAEAVQTTLQWLKEDIPQQGGAVNILLYPISSFTFTILLQTVPGSKSKFALYK